MECGVSECDRKASIMCRPWPTKGPCAMGGGGGNTNNHKYAKADRPDFVLRNRKIASSLLRQINTYSALQNEITCMLCVE